MQAKSKNPLLLAWKLEARNRWLRITAGQSVARSEGADVGHIGTTRAMALGARFVGRRFWRVLGAMAIVIALIALGLLARAPIRGAVHFVSEHLVVAGALVAMLTSVQVHRGRRVWSDYYLRGWLATVPLTSSAVTRVVVMRAAASSVVELVLLSLACTLATPAAPLLSAVWVGGLGGAMLGWWMPHREPPTPRRSMVYSVAPPARGQLTALARWPISQAKLWLPRRAIETLVILGMLALPMDVSGNVAIASVFAFLVFVYLIVLLSATLHVVREGARWLRPTPLSFSRFAWSILRDPMLRQLQWTVAAAVLLIALGIDPSRATRLAEFWLAVVIAASSVATVQAYGSRPTYTHMAVSLGIVTAAEAIKQYAALPCALLISAWHIRKGSRA
jgi:hypothetical protein